MPIGRPSKYTDLERKLKVFERNAWYRCNYPGTNRYEYYGGEGIKFLLSLDDLKFLWKRDNADKLTQPSLGRKNHNKNYTVDNCSFIEFSVNRVDKQLKLCSRCKKNKLWIRSREKECSNCRNLPRCKRCNNQFKPNRKSQQRCSKCDTLTKQCARCGISITRPNKICWVRNIRWLCKKCDWRNRPHVEDS